jgi:hypothetical protein
MMHKCHLNKYDSISIKTIYIKGVHYVNMSFYVLAQIGSDWIGNIVWFLLFFVMIFFYPRLMLGQMLWKLQQTVDMLAGYTTDAKKLVLKKISKTPSKELKDAVNNFMEFFVIEPVSLDPYGIIKKIEHLSDLYEDKLKDFAAHIAPRFDSEAKADVAMSLAGAASLHQIEKIVRHFVELIKKTKNLQLAMILQMQLPLVEKVAKALLKGTEAFANGWPVGDSIGPLVTAHLIENTRAKELDDETLVVKKRIKGKNVVIVRAKGPGGRLGKLGKNIDHIIRREKISRIITIDAALKLEGEKTGSIAEGVGVAIGGLGVDRSYIENISTARKIPQDTVVIKMSQEEAIMPMAAEILGALPLVKKLVEEKVAKSRDKVIIVGVGNTTGVGNDKKSAVAIEDTIRKNAKIMKQREEEEAKREKKRFGWLTSPLGF